MREINVRVFERVAGVKFVGGWEVSHLFANDTALVADLTVDASI